MTAFAALVTIAAAPAPTTPALYLIGEDWIGRWQDGAVAGVEELPGAMIATVVPDARNALWVLAYPANPADDQAADHAHVARYAATTLDAAKPIDRTRFETAETRVAAFWPGATPGHIIVIRTDATSGEAAVVDTTSLAAGPWRAVPPDAVRPRIRAGRWLAPAPMPIGIDSDATIDPTTLLDAITFTVARPAWLPATAHLLALSRNAALVMPGPGTVQVVALPGGKVMSTRSVAARTANDLHAALAPDGSTAIVFTRPESGDAWPGTAWEVKSGKTLPGRDLSIDSGAARELGQSRRLACLLPEGAGAIFTLIGQPADRSSEAILFDGAISRRVPLGTDYVSRCVLSD